jgi:uncharacterized protein (TIGR03118 family)
MTRSLPFQAVLLTTAAFGALCASATLAAAGGYAQTDLVSDVTGLAKIFDSELKNPWGASFLGAPALSPFWISDQGKNAATLYAVTGQTSVSKVNINNPLGLVNIPTTASGPQGPTGQVSNPIGSTSFNVGNGGNGKPALFIFANLNGTISAWNGGTSAIVQWTTPGAVYTGLTTNTAHTMLYAANDAGTGSVNVYNSSFAPITLSPTAFATPSAIAGAGLVPFNVEDIGGNVWVTYAPEGHAAQTTAALGEGAVAEFSEGGVLKTMKVGGEFASPWGLAVAPSTFGKFGGDVLVGNFSFDHSEINAFNPTTWAFEGTIAINDGGQSPGGLWSLFFGLGGKDGSPNTLYFTDGLNGETDGLFGALTAVPEPSTWAMMLVGFGGLALFAARRRVALAVG